MNHPTGLCNLGAIAQVNHGKKSGRGFLIRCPNPAHTDKQPSCHIEAGSDGKVLVHCFAGCEQALVINALKNQGVWPERERQARRQTTKTITATYSYTDERGELLYEIVRYRPKAFVQRFPNGQGGWTWKKHPRQVLYHLPEVLEAAIVFVVEGEKDVETLREWGFVATTNAGGANAPWLPSFTDTLRGREVIIIPDDDVPGRKRAVQIARVLVGHVARLVVLQLPGAKDITAWFEQGHREVELIELIDGAEVSA